MLHSLALPSWSATQWLAAAVASLAGIILWQGLNLPQRLKYRHIPGPKPKWLVGNVLDLYTEGMFVPALYQRWGQRYGSVFRWFLGLQPVVVVQDAELARLVLVKHFAVFHDRHLGAAPVHPLRRLMMRSGILFSRGKYWAGVRAAAAPMFHTAELQSFASVMNAAADKLAGALRAPAAAGTAVDINAMLGHVTMGVISEAAFGVPFSSQDVPSNAQQQQCSNLLVFSARQLLAVQTPVLLRMLTFVPPLLTGLVWRLLRIFPPKVLKDMENVRSRMSMGSLTLAKNAAAAAGVAWDDKHGLERLFESAPGSDEMAALLKDARPAQGTLIDMLVKARNRETGERLEVHQIVAQAQVFLLAGYETTLFLLSHALWQLAQHPDVQKRVLQEVDELSSSDEPLTPGKLERYDFTEALLNECLRLLPSAPMTTREALEDITVGGWFIPKGTVVHVDIYGIQRDPHHFSQPEEFRPERFLKGSSEAERRSPHAFLPFGLGPRNCIGWKFALQEAMTIIIKLLQQYAFAIDESKPQPPPLRYGITIGYPEGVHLVPHKRTHT